MPGTTEGIALELARALEPLQERLATPDGAIALFAEMGLPLPPAVSTAISSAPELAQIVSAVGALAAQVPGLVAAIDAEDPVAIVSAVGAMVTPARDAITRLQGLGTRVRAAFPADLSAFGAEVQALVAALPERLVAWVLVRYLEERRPVLARALALPGLVASTPVAETPELPAHVRRELRLDRLPTLLGDPEALLEEVYAWGSTTRALDAPLVLARLRALLDAVGFFAVLDPAVPELRALVFGLRPAPGGPPTALDLSLLLTALGGLDLQLTEPGGTIDARLRGTGDLALGAGVRIAPPATLTALAPTGAVDGELTLSVARTGAGGAPILLFGELGGTRVTAGALRAAAGARFAAGGAGVQAGLVLEAELVDGQVVVAFGGADGFLSSFLPGTSTLDLDLAARWSEATGLQLSGGAALQIVVPLAVELGPLRLDTLDLRVAPRGGPPPAVALEARVAGSIALGPFAASVEGIGVGADLLLRGGASGGAPPAGAIDLGAAAVAFRFLPPTGLGLAIDAGPVRGGGFIRFDEPAGRYAGVFEVGVAGIGVTAIGLLDTRLPGGARGFALLVVLRGSFPPIQLSFGFALSSIGGLLALNRRIDVDALRARFANGAVGRILAPEDPVRNAPVLLADLAAVFPPTEGVIVVGPTLQLSWVEIVRFDLGVFIELPPLKVVLLGSVRAGIPNPVGGRPLVQLRMDVIGLLDIAKQVLEFDAVLVDSHLLEILELTGGAAFRLSWGAQPYVVLSVGGFHPGWSPAPLSFPPSLTRIAMTRGAPTDPICLRFEGYFAVTTNTLQFGAAVELIASAGPISVRGFLGFDTLIRFQPFFFEITFEASLKVRWKGRTLAGVEITGTITGPGPVTVRARLCFEILFFDICWSETFRLGSPAPPAISPVASAVAELAGELEDPDTLSGGEADDPHVVLEPAAEGATLPVVRPQGGLTWTQKRAPLDLLLQRFEGAPLGRPETVSASGPHVTGPEPDWFAPGSFAELSNAEALNRPAFERLTAGVRLGVAGVADGRAQVRVITVEQIRLPAEPQPGFDFLAPLWLLRAADARSGVVERVAIAGQVAVRDERWRVVGGDGVVLVGAISQSQAHQLARARGGVAAASTDTVPSFAF